MQPLNWYIARLRRMSPAEVGYRVSKMLRRHLPHGSAPTPRPPVAGDSSIAPLLLGTVTAADVDAARLRDATAKLARGRIDVFDLRDHSLGKSPEWCRDPLTATIAPDAPAWRIDYRDPKVVGNIKYLWEPSRHLHLVTLAQGVAVNEDSSAADTLREHLDSWLTQCPPGRGVHWTSALELAIRLINWGMVWELLRHSPLRDRVLPPDGDLEARWLASIFHHMRQIAGNYSRYSSANNHLIGEAAGVFIAGTLWPYWSRTRRWTRTARAILQQELRNQTWPDGGNKEQAISYQQFVLDFFVLAGLTARRSGEDFPNEYWRGIEKMLEFTAGLMDVAGNVPMIGDADDGYVVRLAHTPNFCPYRSLLATGAVLFERPDFAFRSSAADEKTLWLLGAQTRKHHAALLQSAPADRALATCWPHAGYFLLGRDLGTPTEIRMLVDAGPLGYLSIAAHGHADALSMVLNVAGREILVDPGTYCYNTEPEWRRYFRSTRAHNTLELDGLDQSLQQGNFMWSQHASCTVHEFEPAATAQRLRASHDGYRRLSDPVTHTREILFDSELGAFEIIDSLDCARGHAVVQSWHFAEGVAIELHGAAIIARSGPVTVRFEPERAVARVQKLQGSANPPGGWVSRSFGVRRPATTVLWCDEIDGNARWRSRILCDPRGALAH